ncbi:diguanylate cyclase [Geotalea sp. SG265]|uniref:GGDEF domain-containing response regulator n=1 Tax=Geotalea sp. SG265 TaxID=2922867 RepID=UPI001FAEAAC8|nr:diguanylate cyclase [Geotalea sp. SG265]
MERILVVEDDSFFREVFADLLREDGFAVDVAGSGGQALEMMRSTGYGLVITDLVMPDITGLDLLSKVKQFDPSIDVILVTGHANTETAVFALKNGARDYLVKPINNEEFKHTVALCFEQRRLLDENQELKGLINLFQISQTIANSLDFEHIQSVLADSLAKEFGLRRLIGYFLNDAVTLELKEIKGFDEETASALGNLIFDLYKVSEEDTRSLVQLADLERHAQIFKEHSINEAMLFFVRAKTALLGIIIAFNETGSSFPPHLNFKNINFLLDQASLALENTSRYNNARNLLYIDELTGLFNYRYLDIALEREIRRAERYSSNISVVFLDIDLFKLVNDQHGHLVGSKALAEVGLLLQKSVRDVDTVIRYGGDEYTIILVETGIEAASMVAERIRSTIEAHVFNQSEGLNIKLTASLGCASYPNDATCKLQLLELADQAMYRSKAGGKNRVFHISAD